MAADDRDPVLRSALGLRRRTLWFGKLKLYEDHLAIVGWDWTGSVWCPLPITDIRRIDAGPAPPPGANFVIRPRERRDFYCRIEKDVFYWVKELRNDERTEVEVQHGSVVRDRSAGAL